MEDEEQRDTSPFNIPLDGIADIVDLMVAATKSDGPLAPAEFQALAAVINTLNRTVLERSVTTHIVEQSLERLRRNGVRRTIERVGTTLGHLGKLKDALGLALDVATSEKPLSEFSWTTLVIAGRAGQLTPDEIRDIIGPCPYSDDQLR